ncbi:DNAj domain (prokaryotic heat shock protein)-related [Anaeramoeba ignava]|uniref:DNAj domain (Prokaryotic heat shock protein)-related n=1 Tax=Anaeramoeba ignava TaxID=1746090 RepID=A0A9Q0RBX7_ANAIG|nr:DNAj domain (prokaryotic heat shock protein)-related [Anaeramoeba ignava]
MQSQINQIDNIEQFIDIWKPLSSLFIKKKQQKEQQEIISLLKKHFDKLISNLISNLKSKSKLNPKSESFFEHIISKQILQNFPYFIDVFKEFVIDIYSEKLIQTTFHKDDLQKIPKEIEIKAWEEVYNKKKFLKFNYDHNQQKNQNQNEFDFILNKFDKIKEAKIEKIWIYLINMNNEFQPKYKGNPFNYLSKDFQIIEKIKNQIENKTFELKKYEDFIQDNLSNLIIEIFPGTNFKEINKEIKKFKRNQEIIQKFNQNYLYSKNINISPNLNQKIEQIPNILIKDISNYFEIPKEIIERINEYTSNSIHESKWIKENFENLIKENQENRIIEIIENLDNELQQIYNKFIQKQFTLKEIEEDYIPKLNQNQNQIEKEIQIEIEKEIQIEIEKEIQIEIEKEIESLHYVVKSKNENEKQQFKEEIINFSRMNIFNNYYEVFKFFFEKNIKKETNEIKDLTKQFPIDKNQNMKVITEISKIYKPFLKIEHNFLKFISYIFPLNENENQNQKENENEKYSQNLFKFIEEHLIDWKEIIELIDFDFYAYSESLNFIKNGIIDLLGENSQQKSNDLKSFIENLEKNKSKWNNEEFQQKQKQLSNQIEDIHKKLPEIENLIKLKLQNPKQRAKRNLDVILNNNKIFKFKIQDQVEFSCEILSKTKNDKSLFNLEDFVEIDMILVSDEKNEKNENENEKQKVIEFSKYFPDIYEMIDLLTNLKTSIHPKYKKDYSTKFNFENNSIQKHLEEIQKYNQKLKKNKRKWEEFQKEVLKKYYYSLFLSFDQIKIFYNLLISKKSSKITNKKEQFLSFLNIENNLIKWERDKEDIKNDFKLFIQELHQIIEEKQKQKEEKQKKKKQKTKKQKQKQKQEEEIKKIEKIFLKEVIDEKQPIFVIQIEEEVKIYEFITILYIKYTGNFPKKEQILFCNKNTSEDDIFRFIKLFEKSININEKEIFSIIFAHKLPKKLQNLLIKQIQKVDYSNENIINSTPNQSSKSKSKSKTNYKRILLLFSLKDTNETKKYSSIFQSNLNQKEIENTFDLNENEKEKEENKREIIVEKLKKTFPKRYENMKLFISKFSSTGKTFQIRKHLFEINEKENEKEKYEYCYINVKEEEPQKLIEELINYDNNNNKKCFHLNLSYFIENEICEIIWIFLIFGIIEDKRCFNSDYNSFIFKPEKHLILFEIPSNQLKGYNYGLNKFTPLKMIENFKCEVNEKTFSKYIYEIDSNQIISKKINEKMMKCGNFIDILYEKKFKNFTLETKEKYLK